MDKLENYRELLKSLLARYAELLSQQPTPDTEVEVVLDETGDNYMLVEIGWSNRKRVKQTVLYVRLRYGKFWVEEDSLEEGIATDLLASGVPKEDIILAFHHPDMRPYTEFAAA
jgi:hypothetical protein